jgi:hypothetical protein
MLGHRKEETIKYQFPLKKGMEHFPRKRKKLLFDSILRANYELDASSFENTLFYFLHLAQRR